MIFLLLGGIGLPGGAVYIETWRLRSKRWESAVSLGAGGQFGAGGMLSIVCILRRSLAAHLAGDGIPGALQSCNGFELVPCPI